MGGQFLRSIGLPVRNVLGYRGSSGVFAALERKEVDGRLTSQANVETTYRRFLDEGIIRPILSLGKDPRVKPFPGVTTLDDLKLDADQRKVLQASGTSWGSIRSRVSWPGT